jgi:protein SCO1/2
MKQHRVGSARLDLPHRRQADVERAALGAGLLRRDPLVDADIGQHTGMVRVGNDSLQRWAMAPLLQEPHLILETLMAVDPVSRAAGRSSFMLGSV